MAAESSPRRDHHRFECRRVRDRRIATALLWGCLTITAISAALWTTSLRWTAFWMTQFGDTAGIRPSNIFYIWTSHELREELVESADGSMATEPIWKWHCSTRRIPMEWWPPVFYSRHPTGRAIITVHLGVPFAVGLVGAFFARRWLRRHPRPGQCPTCGYSTIGLPAEICPECGRPFSTHADPFRRS